MKTILFLGFSLSFLITALLAFFLEKLALKKRILIPGGVPLIGGIAIGISFLFTAFFIFSFHKILIQEIIGLVLASFFILIFGILDDVKELSVLSKFMVQVIAASILIFFGIKTKIIYIGNFLNLAVTLVWIIGITNSFNLLDILDGLAGGAAFIIGLSFLVISIFNFDIRVMLLSLILIGAVLGFLVYNFPPAKIYLGNSGSHFLGFILSAVAIYISYAPLTRKVALFSPILILGFPIFDTAFLIFMRAKQGRSAFKKSKDHFALRFLKLGYSKETTLLLMLILALFFSLAGVFISQSTNPFGIAIIIAVSLISLILTLRIGSVKIDG